MKQDLRLKSLTLCAGTMKHTAKLVKSRLIEQKFSVMKWPARSPGMNPIENFWLIIKIRMERYESPALGICELGTRTQKEW